MERSRANAKPDARSRKKDAVPQKGAEHLAALDAAHRYWAAFIGFMSAPLSKR
jgi:hypothetical protein